MKKLIVSILLFALLLGLCGCDASNYKEAVSLFESGNYEEALALFTELGEYEDSAEQVLRCHFHLGMKHLEQQEMESAIVEFATAEGCEDSDTQALSIFRLLSDNSAPADIVKLLPLAKPIFERNPETLIEAAGLLVKATEKQKSNEVLDTLRPLFESGETMIAQATLDALIASEKTYCAVCLLADCLDQNPYADTVEKLRGMLRDRVLECLAFEKDARESFQQYMEAQLSDVGWQLFNNLYTEWKFSDAGGDYFDSFKKQNSEFKTVVQSINRDFPKEYLANIDWNMLDSVNAINEVKSALEEYSTSKIYSVGFTALLTRSIPKFSTLYSNEISALDAAETKANNAIRALCP